MSQEIIVTIIGVVTACVILKKFVDIIKNREDIGKCAGCSGCAFKQQNNQQVCSEGVNKKRQ